MRFGGAEDLDGGGALPERGPGVVCEPAKGAHGTGHGGEGGRIVRAHES